MLEYCCTILRAVPLRQEKPADPHHLKARLVAVGSACGGVRQSLRVASAGAHPWFRACGQGVRPAVRAGVVVLVEFHPDIVQARDQHAGGAFHAGSGRACRC